MEFDWLAFRLAWRTGFEAGDVPAVEPDPHPMCCGRPEAWPQGTGGRSWLQLSETVRMSVDPYGEKQRLAESYDDRVRSRNNSAPRPPPPPSETVRGSIPFDDIIDAMGVLSSEKPQAADEEWSACTAQAGDVVAVLDKRGGHAGGAAQWEVHQVIKVEVRSEGGRARGRHNNLRDRHLTLRRVDTRVENDEEEAEEWETQDLNLVAQRHGLQFVYLGKAAFEPPTEESADDMAATMDEAGTPMAATAPYPPFPGQPFSPSNPRFAPPALGCDATSFFSNAEFLCAWLFIQDPHATRKNNNMAWIWRCVGGHSPKNDRAKLIDL